MIDGLFIRSLLMAFFFKIFPDIIRDGRLYIAEPPLYRVSDKKNPFVINMADYNERYVKQASKDYKLGYKKSSKDIVPEYLTKDQWFEFLSESTNYVDDIETLTKHYKVNDRLLEMILEEFSYMGYDDKVPNDVFINRLNIQHLMNRIGTEFKELYYDDKDNVIKGAIDSKYQMISINQELLRKSSNLINIMNKWLPGEKGEIILKDIRTSTEQSLSLLSILKILKKYQPNILHRFKGLGENDEADIKTTIMDPNTRTLIRVQIGDIENDMSIFQMLRGGTPADALGRKLLINEFKFDQSMIDT